MKILITGNMGYVGPAVTAQLRNTYPAATLEGVDLAYFAHCLTDAPVLPEYRLDRQHFADVRKLPLDILKGVDAIVHLAAISNDPMGNAYENVTYAINHRASVELARLAREAGVKTFVFASSCSMYGFAEGGPRTEQDSLNPLTAYAKSKVLTEQGVQQLANSSFKVTCLRFATACGMSPRLRLDLVLNDFVACAVASRKITILSDGTPWRPLITTRDMARAIDWAILRDQAVSGDFLAINAGCNEWNFQVRDLAQAVADIIPGTEISINRDAPPDKRSYKVCFDLYKRLAPDHQPQSDLRETIGELRDRLQAMNFLNANFRESRYMRLKVLTHLRETGLLSEALTWN
jgi:nucleoside-diphosphate-sugar epimerase